MLLCSKNRQVSAIFCRCRFRCRFPPKLPIPINRHIPNCLLVCFVRTLRFTRKIVKSAQFVMFLRLIWINKCIPNLTLRQKWFQPERNVQVGDVVLLAENMQQRSKWVMGRVLETYPDKHGKVRTVLLKTSGSTMKRPIAKLCVILSESAC